MRRKRMIILSVAAATLLTVALFFIFAASRWFGTPLNEIVLSSEVTPANASPDTSSPLPPGKLPAVVPLAAEAGNVKKIIETLERPQAYKCEVKESWYWPDGSDMTRTAIYVRNNVTKVEQLDENGAVTHHNLTNGLLFYTWEEGSGQVHSGFLGEMSEDDLSGIPTYKSLLEINQDDIISAQYINEDGEDYLIVRDREPVYEGVYYISLKTGLLHKAEFFEDDELAIGFVFSVSIEVPDEAHYTIPGGITLLE